MEPHKVFAIKLPMTLYEDLKERADSQEMFVSEYIRKMLIAYPRAIEAAEEADKEMKKREVAAMDLIMKMVNELPKTTENAIKKAMEEVVK